EDPADHPADGGDNDDNESSDDDDDDDDDVEKDEEDEEEEEHLAPANPSVVLIDDLVPSRHCRSDCPERKNRNHENQTRGAGARGAVHALREGETDQDPNNIKDEIKA
ncbi:hypothetical protein Tco_0719883, partial [Tanacetum coccineum]